MAPKVGVPVLDLHGSKDTTVPANVSLSADGYYYTTTDEIFNGGDYSEGWKAANGCKGKGKHWPTQWDGEYDFYCATEGDCPGGDVIRCMWNGGHNWLFNDATANGGLLTKFLLQWTKPSHAGFGYSEGDNALRVSSPLTNLRFLGRADPSQNVTAAFAALPTTLKPPSLEAVGGASMAIVERRSHYGNPANGCREDEDAVLAGTGRVCARKISTVAASNGTADAPPEPQCKLGGGAPHANSCPTDAEVAPWSKAFPVCIAKSPHGEPDPYTNGDFHCLLACPCEGGAHATECSALSHTHCPRGSRCERGELRNRAHGVCTYHR